MIVATVLFISLIEILFFFVIIANNDFDKKQYY